MKQFNKTKAIKIFLIPFLLIVSGTINAQMGIGTNIPNASAQLDISSTSKGFLPPRMTQAQGNAIVNPVPGLMIWCTDCGLTGEILVYNGATWTKTVGRQGKNYYVSANGDDGNNGLTPSTAWKTVDKVNAQMPTMSPGDSILFERGSYFFGTISINKSGTASNPIVFGAYGTGSKPVFIAAVTILSGEQPIADLHPIWKYLGNDNWEYKDDVTNYQVLDIANLVLREKDATKDSFGIKLMSYDSTLLSQQGQFWYSYYTRSIRIHSVEDPRNKYYSIKMVLSVNAIEFHNNSYIIFENQDFRYYGKCVVEASGNYCSFRNLDISYIGGADHSSNDPKEIHYRERYGNGLQIWNSGHDVTITGCRIDNVYDAGISPQGISDTSKEGKCETTLIVYNIYIRNNIITNCEFSFEFFENVATIRCRSLLHNVHDIYFENNTCVNAGGGWSHNQRWATLKRYNYPEAKGEPNPDGTHFRVERLDAVTSNTSNIFIRNNIFCGATEKLFWVVTPSFLNKYISDYNDFWQKTEPPKGPEPVGSFYGYGNPNTKYFPTLISWQAASSQEAHSYNDNPLFVSPTDFHLQAGSPLIGKGIDVGYGKYVGAYPFIPSGNQ